MSKDTKCTTTQWYYNSQSWYIFHSIVSGKQKIGTVGTNSQRQLKCRKEWNHLLRTEMVSKFWEIMMSKLKPQYRLHLWLTKTVVNLTPEMKKLMAMTLLMSPD